MMQKVEQTLMRKIVQVGQTFKYSRTNRTSGTIVYLSHKLVWFSRFTNLELKIQFSFL